MPDTYLWSVVKTCDLNMAKLVGYDPTPNYTVFCEALSS